MHIAISKAQINSNANPGHSKPIKNTFIYTTTSHTRLKQQRLSKNTSIFHHHQLNAHITALISRQIKTCHTNSTLVLSLDTHKNNSLKGEPSTHTIFCEKSQNTHTQLPRPSHLQSFKQTDLECPQNPNAPRNAVYLYGLRLRLPYRITYKQHSTDTKCVIKHTCNTKPHPRITKKITKIQQENNKVLRLLLCEPPKAKISSKDTSKFSNLVRGHHSTLKRGPDMPVTYIFQI